MSDISKQTLLSLRDFIGDALSDPDVTPQEIAQAIIDELTELVEYHSTAHSKAKETLSLFDRGDDITDRWREVSKPRYDNPYLDWLNANNGDHFLGGMSDDTISFDYYSNKKGRKNKDK